MERALGDRGRELVEVWGAARAAKAEGEVISLEQAPGATVFVQTAAQLPGIRQVSPVIRFNVLSVVLR
jgi:hypothetical protein